MSAFGTARRWFVKAVERGDSRPALLLGAAISLVVAAAFAWHWPGAEQAELYVLDQSFRLRPPIEESEQILLVDMNDATFREIDWPMPRPHYAQAIRALHHLGARQVVFDVQFKTIIPRTGKYDEKTADYILHPDDRQLRSAIRHAGNVMLAYFFDLQEQLSPKLKDRYPRIREVFSRNVGADAKEVALGAGLLDSEVEPEIETLRHRVVLEFGDEYVRRNPTGSFDEFASTCAHGKKLEHADLRILQYAWQRARGAADLGAKILTPEVEGLSPNARRGWQPIAPFRPFLLEARDFGCANADPDRDGVMRLPYAYLVTGDRPCFTLGMESALRSLTDKAGERVLVVVRPGEIAAKVFRPDGGLRSEIRIPVDEQGRILVNWAGNRNRKRESGSGSYFENLPFHKLVEFYERRYENLDWNVRRLINELPKEKWTPDYHEYLKLGDRIQGALKGEVEMTAAEVGEIETRMDAIRKGIRKELEDGMAALEKALPKQSPRTRKGSEEYLAKLRGHYEGIRPAYDLEDELRPQVKDKICIIGSASTSSGDLHSTPLGGTIPGMDVQANVVNMVLTNQPLRRVPVWVNFVALVVVGLLVTLAVMHWGATGSTIFSAVLVAVALGAYWWLFTGPMILMTGAGPAAMAVLNFAGVMTFKEVVTRRSKRKLQHELEKNTSPELVAIVLEHPELVAKPREMVGTFFFSDVKSFTSLSEKMDAEVLFPFINRYLDRMTQSLKGRGAYLDKYIGDGIMALFGIPVPSADHARNACLAALENQELLRGLNEEFAREGLPKLGARIGIHSGSARAGYVGATDRSEYTVMGDNVNLASRLEGANKGYESVIMISGETRDLVGDAFLVRELDWVRVVGKRQAVRVFELIGRAGTASSFDPGFLDEYRSALGLFRERRWKDSLEAFERALVRKPGDKPCGIHIARATEFLTTPPPPDWDGVFDLHSK